MITMLTTTYSGEEVYEALQQMHQTKAPSLDGMCAIFYQKFWGIVGPDVIQCVIGILNKGEEIESVNKTHIVLIPKKKTCESPVDFIPISLFNVLYKLVAEVLANRLSKSPT